MMVYNLQYILMSALFDLKCDIKEKRKYITSSSKNLDFVVRQHKLLYAPF